MSFLCPADILWYLVVPMVRASPFSAYVSFSPFPSSLSLFFFPLRARTIEYSVRLLRTRRPRSLLSPEASCSCIRWNSVINQIKMSCLLTAPPWIYSLLFQLIYCIIMYGYEYYMEPHTECMVRCLIAELIIKKQRSWAGFVKSTFDK